MLELLLIPLLAFAAVPRQEAQVPANDGWVTDLAGMLSPDEERALEALMESYDQGTRRQVALLTVPDLGGRALEDFSLGVARAWGIGDKESDSGALLLVARDERQLRIEVGYGLEGQLTDALAGRIIREVIAPELRAGRPADGLRKGVEAIHAALGGEYAPPARHATRAPAAGLLALMPIGLVVVLIALAARDGRRRKRRGFPLGPFLLMNMGGRGGGFSGGRGGFGGGGLGGGGGFGGFRGGGFGGGGASGRW